MEFHEGREGLVHSHERRELAEIENRLALDDPEWFRQFSTTPSVWPRLRVATALLSAVLAGAGALIGDAVGFLLCSLLSAALFAFRSWRIQAD